MVKKNLHIRELEKLAQLVRYHILTMTHQAGSGHPSSSLSAVELMVTLFFSGLFKFDLDNPDNCHNDRIIFSKGHASPLFYTLWALAENGGSTASLSRSGSGIKRITPEELLTYRQSGSRLEGHPTPAVAYTEAATGSLGQGLSVGFGQALNAKYLDHTDYQTYVLLGDSEMTEGAIWEAAALAAHYQLDNLTAVVDVNRLGQTGPTIHGHNLKAYQQKLEAFGWSTVVVEGHSIPAVYSALKHQSSADRPRAVLARTIKGKGVSFIENEEGWHGRVLDDHLLQKALLELGTVDTKVRGRLPKPQPDRSRTQPESDRLDSEPNLGTDHLMATREAYGEGLAALYSKFPELVALDAEVRNSTKVEIFAQQHPDRFFPMYAAEQNMISAAVGLARRGKLPFVSSFAAFLTRAFDQLRMARYSQANLKLVGSHGGVSIGQDGSSQMGLEDIAMFRAIPDSVVLYPADAVSTIRLMEAAAEHQGLVYIRTTRQATPILYSTGGGSNFKIGGSRVLRRDKADQVTVLAAGVTVHQALEAYEKLKTEGLMIRVIDLYSVKPLDSVTLARAAKETVGLIVAEDHYPAGGLGEAVYTSLVSRGCSTSVDHLAVYKVPGSGTPEENLARAGLDCKAIIKAVKKMIRKN